VKVKEYNASISKCQKSEKETHDKCANILAKEMTHGVTMMML
jgi:hypothetical protein